MRNLRIRDRLLLAFVAVVLSFSAFVVLYFPQREHRVIVDALEQRARVVADTLARSAEAAVDFGDAESAASLLRSARVETALRYGAIISGDGSTLASFVDDTFTLPGPSDLVQQEPIVIRDGLLHVTAPIGVGRKIGSVALGLSLEEVDAADRASIAATTVVGGLMLAIGALLAFVMANLLTRPIASVTQLAQRVASGDMSVAIGTQSAAGDEVGQMARSLNQMVLNLQAISRQAEAIAQGDFTQTIEPRGEHDKLAVALNQMTKNLRDVSLKNERESWLKTGQAELSAAVRGELDVPTLSRNIIGFLCRYVGGVTGVLFVARDDEKLVLTASYAFVRRKDFSTELGPGEGIPGQAALEKELFVVRDLPEGHIEVQSGLGRSQPTALVAVPFLFQNKVVGVAEIARIGDFTDLHLTFLEQVGETLAIALTSAADRERMRFLLDETRRQSEELRQKQDELQKANAELTEHTRVLRLSEEKLRLQSEELQAANEELEESTQYLQAQKKEIEEKNREIQRRSVELQAKARDLEQANRYKSEFLSNMSHELRTPLNSLLILSGSLAENEEGNLTPDQVQAAKIIHTGGRDLLNLINDILDLSKVEAGKLDIYLEPTSVESVVANLKRQFAPISEDKGVPFQVEVAPGTPGKLTTDGKRLEQVLRNFLANAFKFTKSGSVALRIGPAREGVQYRKATLAAAAPVEFSVVDTGIGIPKAKLDLIFEAFQQADGSTSRQYGGTGLGLTISRQLAGLLQGEIQVTSEEGKGSCFTLYLPSVSQSHAEPSPQASPSEPLSMAPNGEWGAHRTVSDDRDSIVPESRSVLIIEDDLEFAATLMEVTRRRGYLCAVAAEGRQGLKLADELQPTAILLDIGLPDIDGYKVLDQLKSSLSTRHIPVHIISAAEAHSRDGQRGGAIGYLQKPVALEALDVVFRRIEQLIEGGEHRRVLLVEDNQDNAEAIQRVIANDHVTVDAVASGKEALERLEQELYHCVILDLGLPDLSGFEFLREAHARRDGALPPIIVNSARDLSREEHRELSKYAASIVVKGANSSERLVDEVLMFLHSVEASLSPRQRALVRQVHEPGLALRNKTVLLVDDDLRNTFALSSVLRKHGMTVLEAENGQQAIATLEKSAAVDLVLMDIMMPVMDGFEAMRAIRSRPQWQKLPIIALTAKAMTEDRGRCFEAGANDYLTKPVNVDQLLTAMRVWLFDA